MKNVWWYERWRARRADAAAIAAIILFFTLFFWQALFGGEFLMAGDIFYYSYPLRTIMWDMIRQGSPPLWTPLVLSGYPLLSMSQLAVGYPLTWTYLFLPGYWAEEVYILAPYLLAPAFTYCYAREIGRSPMAALLAGFTFGYSGMMASGIAMSGIMTNAVVWLPLMLITIERARTRRFFTMLPLATGAYAMSVLNGHAQSFSYVGIIALAYAAFVGLTSRSAGGANFNGARRWLAWNRWKPLAVAVGAILLSMGIAAFQILETMRAVRRSIRDVITYETFGTGAFTPLLALKSLVAPLHNFVDLTTYVPPLALALAILGTVAAVRNTSQDTRIFFWLGTAVVAWVLMLGSNTPFYRLVYYVPLLNRFRGPSRHAFEWSFAVGILAAYGWDALSAGVPRLKSMLDGIPRRSTVALILLLLSTMVAALWWRATGSMPVSAPGALTGQPESSYLLWKAIFTLFMAIAFWMLWRTTPSRRRTGLLLAAMMLACFIEPFILISRWWWPVTKTAARITAVSPATRFLQQYPPEQNRVYTRVDIFAEQMSASPRLDAPNLTALYGLQNVASYEQLILERYSHALGNVGADTVHPRPGSTPDRTLFEPNSHVLDLLNTTYVVTFSNLSIMFEEPIKKEEIEFAPADTLIEVGPGETKVLPGTIAEGDTLAFVTALSNSISENNGTPIARLRISTQDGRIIERELRAGVDTAEGAHEHPDARAIVQHSLAPVFDRMPGDSTNSTPLYRYWSRLPLGERLSIDRVEIVNLTQQVRLSLWKATFYDSASKNSIPLLRSYTIPVLHDYAIPVSSLKDERWQLVYHRDGVLIFHNRRALPRVWLVTEAEAVDGEEALRRIRGESERSFDPRRTALLEIAPEYLPKLPGGPISPNATARLVLYEPNRLVVETMADTPSVLVLGEMIYPGWEATLDGVKTPIHATNFLLRAVVVPAGTHRVEMEYKAPAARNGAVISIFSLLVILAAAIYARLSPAS